MLLFFSIYDLLLDFNLIDPIYNIHNGYPFGFLILVFLMTVFLANNFARSNRELLEKEREKKEMELSQKLLEAENKRKEKELNDARDLQLSLLPHCETNINNYSFCFSMRPATEVGGDYYDYRISEDNVISLVVGDATDHGLKAGMMVSIVKSLFLTLDEKTPIVEFLIKSSKTIKQMKLKNLYMALMMLRIESNKVTFSSAGIPPLLVYRRETNAIEEYKIKGMPLGAVDSFPYETISLSLEKHDVVLLMTDGLPELFDSNKKSFGYKKLKEEFLKNAHKNPTEIVDNLIAAGDEWKGNAAQNDDITLVAFQLNS